MGRSSIVAEGPVQHSTTIVKRSDCMKRISLPALTAMVLACSVLSATAHPGHGFAEHGPWHVLTSPYHLAMLALAGGATLVASRFVRSRLPRRLLQGAGFAAFLAAALLLGIR